MDVDIKELARTDMREAMRKEIKRNQDFVDRNWIKRNTPREVKEAVFYAMARNNALYHFLLIADPIPQRLQGTVMITEEFKDLMHRAGAKNYPLEIKRKAELDLYYDYTHLDYKRRRHFIDKVLPKKPRSIEVFEYVGKIFGLIILTGLRLWWVLLIVFIGWGVYSSSTQPSNYSKSSSGHSNTFESGGVSGGNPISKPVSDSPQVKDGSGQAGFGNGGVSGHDAPSSAETIDNVSSGRTIKESTTGQSTILEPKSISTKSDDEKFDVKEGYFTLGSTKDEVISVMSEPDTQSSSSFSYGFSLVFFNNDKVSEWSKIDRDLKVSIGDKKGGAEPFTVGSTRRQVVDAMGTPSSANTDSFTYGHSLVFFDTGGKVSGWSKIGGSPLKVKFGEKVVGAEPFKVGSTVNEVVSVMGTPDTYNATSLGYGYSLVFFQNGKVSSYKNISKNLKVK